MMIFSGSLIFILLLNFVVSKSLVYKAFSQMDSRNCPSPAPEISDSKLYSKNIKASSKFQRQSYTMSPKKILNNLKFDDLSKIILTETNSIFAISLSDIEINTNISVCIENNGKLNGTLELFIPNLSNSRLSMFILYDSDGSSVALSRVTTIDDSYKTYKNTIASSGCFAIQNNGNKNEKNAILFRWKEVQTQNCLNENIAIASTSDESAFDIFSASPDGECEAIILANPSFTPNIKINSFGFNSNENMVFKSGLNDKPLFEVKPKYFLDWISVLIYTPVITAIVKADATLYIDSSDGRSISTLGQPIINVCNIGQKGIIASPSYGGMNLYIEFTSFFVFENENNLDLSTSFQVKEINGDVTVDIKGDKGSGLSLTTSDVNKTRTLNGNNIKVTYFPKDPKNDYFLIEYTIIDVTTTDDSSTTATSPLITTITTDDQNHQEITTITSKITSEKDSLSTIKTSPLIITSTIINGQTTLHESRTSSFSTTEPHEKSTVVTPVVVSKTTTAPNKESTTLLPTFKPNEPTTTPSTELLETTTQNQENEKTSPITKTIPNESEPTKQTIFTESSTPGTSTTTQSRDEDTTTITTTNEQFTTKASTTVKENLHETTTPSVFMTEPNAESTTTTTTIPTTIGPNEHKTTLAALLTEAPTTSQNQETTTTILSSTIPNKGESNPTTLFTETFTINQNINISTTTTTKITKATTTKKNNATTKLFGLLNIFWFCFFKLIF